MDTNMTGFRGFSIFLVFCVLDESSLRMKMINSKTIDTARLTNAYPKHKHDLTTFDITLQIAIQVNLDMTDSMGPGKLVRHIRNYL